MIVDPTDPKAGAIDEDGTMLYPLYLVPKVADPYAPTVAEMEAGTFIGYGRFYEGGGDDDGEDGGRVGDRPDPGRR